MGCVFTRVCVKSARTCVIVVASRYSRRSICQFVQDAVLRSASQRSSRAPSRLQLSCRTSCNESPHELEPHDAPWSLAPLRFLRSVPGCLPFDFCRLTAKSSIQHDLPERPHRNPAQHTRHTGRPTEWHAPQRGSKDSVKLSKEPDEYRCYGCDDIRGASRSLAHYSNGTATCRLFERRASLVILHPKTLTRYPTRLRIRFHFLFSHLLFNNLVWNGVGFDFQVEDLLLLQGAISIRRATGLLLAQPYNSACIHLVELHLYLLNVC